MGRLADQVERDVGEAEVDLDRRRVAAPFAEALAEDQGVVAEPKQIFEADVAMLVLRRRIERPLAGRAGRKVDGRERRHLHASPSEMGRGTAEGGGGVTWR